MRMRKFNKMMIGLLLCFIILNQLGGAVQNVYAKDVNVHAASKKGKEVAELVEKEVSSLVAKKKTVGATTSVVEGNDELLSKGFGYADIDNKCFVDSTKTAFRIGSISKTFIALAAMELVEEGKLNMDADISSYLEDDFPKFKYSITMKDLLTHTAGFENRDSGLFFNQSENQKSLKDYLIAYKPEQVFKPKEVMAYSNYGMALAGYVIERISNEKYSDFVQKHIFDVLDMNSSSAASTEYGAESVSKGYGQNQKERQEGFVNAYPAGAITSTAQDMANYIKFLVNKNEDIIKQNYKEEMFQKQFSMDEEYDGIGYSWGRNIRNKHLILCHEGGTDNFSSVIILFPEDKIGVFISCNTQIDLTDLTEKVISCMYGEESLPQENVQENVQEKEHSLIDISGNYQSTVSSFTNEEKFYSFMQTIQISGSLKDGFTYNGKELTYLGNEKYYHPDLGYFKFISKNGHLFMANKESFCFVKIPWYEGAMWQLFLISSFLLISVVRLLALLVITIKKKRFPKNQIGFLLQFVIFSTLIIKTGLFFMDIHFGDVERFLVFLKAGAFVMALFTIVEIGISVVKIKKHFSVIRMIQNLSSILVLIWLFQVNLI